jgi:hypothetical protein
MDDKEFTKEEVRQFIESLQPKKAPGPTESQMKELNWYLKLLLTYLLTYLLHGAEPLLRS